MFKLFKNPLIVSSSNQATELQKSLNFIHQLISSKTTYDDMLSHTSVDNMLSHTSVANFANANHIVELGYQMHLILQPLAFKDWQSLTDAYPPVLIQIAQNFEYRVLIKCKRHKYFLYNPETEQIEILPEKKIQHLVAHQMWQCFPLLKLKNASFIDLFSNIVTKFKLTILFTCVLALLSAFTTFSLSISSGMVIAHLDAFSTYALSVVMIALCLVLLANFILNYLNNIYNHQIMVKLMTYIMPTLWHHLLSIPLKKISAFTSGDIIQRLFDFEAALLIHITLAWSLIYNAAVIFLLFCYMCTISDVLTIFYGIVCLIFFSIKIFIFKINHHSLSQRLHKQGQITNYLSDLFLQLHKVRTSGFEERGFTQAWQNQIHHKMFGAKIIKLEMLASACDILLPCVLFVILVLLLYVQPHQYSIAAILTFILCSLQFNFFIEQFSLSANSFIQQFPAYTRIKTLLALPHEQYKHTKIITTPCPLIEFCDVQLVNQTNDQIILNKVSLRLTPGSFVGLVGASGAGKSSIVRLLLGFEQATAGQIYIEGEDIKYIDLIDLRRKFGVVLQTTNLLPGSIYANIAANTHLTLDEAWQLAEEVGLAQDIKQMPMTIFTYISDNAGETLSGGQKQKILIARALATKPSILLLDEATSALDNHSQAIIYQHLKSLSITRLVIAHRYSTIKDADVIYKLDLGKISFSGNYAELMNLDIRIG